jgi:outer membrane protein assembly factor BamB
MDRFSTAALVPALAAVISGCAGPSMLMPPPGAVAASPRLETPCSAGQGAADCLAKGLPAARLSMPEGIGMKGYALSPDGSRLAALQVGGLSLAMWDLPGKRLLWDRPLPYTAPDEEPPASLLFLHGGRLAVSAANLLVVLDASTGQERWRFTGEKSAGWDLIAGPGGWSLAASYVEEGDYFLLVSHHHVVVLDAAAGTEIGRAERGAKRMAPAFTASRPVAVGSGVLLVDGGLFHLPPRSRVLDWTDRFTTFVKDPKSGEKIGEAVAYLLTLGIAGFTDSSSPSYRAGRVALPAASANRVVVGALGRLYGFEASTGRRTWAVDLAVPQIAEVEIDGDSALVLAGGSHLYYPLLDGMPQEQPPVRYGLFRIRLSDGSADVGFRASFNANRVARVLSDADVKEFDETAAWKAEAQWLRLAAAQAGGREQRPPDAAYGYVRLVTMRRIEAGLLVAGGDDVWLLDPSTGREIRRYPLGEIGTALQIVLTPATAVVRATGGVASFSRDTGERLSSFLVARPLPGSCEALLHWNLLRVGTSPSNPPAALKSIPRALTSSLGAEVAAPVWSVPGENSILACAAGPTLQAFDALTGATVWELPVKTTGLDDHMTVTSVSEIRQRGVVTSFFSPSQKGGVRILRPTKVAVETPETGPVVILSGPFGAEIYRLR